MPAAGGRRISFFAAARAMWPIMMVASDLSSGRRGVRGESGEARYRRQTGGGERGRNGSGAGGEVLPPSWEVGAACTDVVVESQSATAGAAHRQWAWGAYACSLQFYILIYVDPYFGVHPK